MFSIYTDITLTIKQSTLCALCRHAASQQLRKKQYALPDFKWLHERGYIDRQGNKVRFIPWFKQWKRERDATEQEGLPHFPDATPPCPPPPPAPLTLISSLKIPMEWISFLCLMEW